MPTFLTTPRMSPALRARIERSVSHRAGARHQAKRHGMGRAFEGRGGLGAGKLIPLVALGVVALLVWMMHRQDERQIEEERAAVLAELTAHRAGLPPGRADFLATTERWVAELSADPYAGDFVAPDLLVPGELDDWLSRPAVYLRGATPELRSPGGRIDEAAASSTKDAFLRCLVEPPASRDERAVLGEIRGVYFAGWMVDRETANIRRFDEVRQGLAVLSHAFEAEARAADALAPLQKLGKELSSAPPEAAEDAATAELLIAVADEIDDAQVPAKPGPTDGSLGARAEERPHDARVALVDLGEGRVLLRVRRRIDASGRSEGAKAVYRASIQGCDLALEVRSAAED
jgi:hypothetical protein